jgi:hypothetical protein
MEENDLGDLAAALQCLTIALGFAPNDAPTSAQYRRVARLVHERTASARVEPAAIPPRAALHEEPSPAPTPHATPLAEPSAAEPEVEPSEPDPAVVEAKIEELTSRLRADPRDARVANELAALLERAGRDLDLLSLLSARIDEAAETERAQFEKDRVRVLTRLAERARAVGRAAEAELYEIMLR